MAQTNIVAKFKDEGKLLKALTRLKENKVNLIDVYGPFANHDILKLVTRESRLPYMAVIYGFTSIILIFGFMYYTSVIDYPLSYGGKPIFSFPPMVVVMFLFCILFTTIMSVLSFHARAQIFPGKPSDTIDPSVTDDSFFLVLDQNYNPDEIKEWLQEDGADEITEKEI
ncbi:MAG: DUF3341 domain-containing protein [Bacteroidetes bacterium]|nr:MAG: DUF3341 domain-containing protein [Bacteroidota bacterium]